MRLRTPAIALALSVAGCASGGSSTGPPASSALSIDVNGQPAQQVTLMAQQFIAPGSFIATLTLSPTPEEQDVAWSASTSAVVKLGNTDPTYLSGSPTPPPGGTFVYLVGTSFGKSVVTATVGSRSATIPVYTYASLALRCQFRYQAAYSFDPGSGPTGLTSDLYATEAVDSGDLLDPCSKTVFVTGVSAVHFPYGGVVVPGNFGTFSSIAASQWSNTATQLPESAIDNGVLLFKTKAGRIVKAMLPLGPYEVSDANGTFPY